MNNDVQFMSLKEAEKKYKIKYDTAYKYVVTDKRIPYYRLGRNVRFKEEDFFNLFELVEAK